MAKSKSNKVKTPKNKQKRVRKGIPLKRYNKILSSVVKNYKKKGIPYDLKEVRRGVSALYPKYKDVAPSRIPVREVREDFELVISELNRPKIKDTYTIQATEVPKYWFDEQTSWFLLDEFIMDFNNTYPEIPIVLKTPDNELKIQGQLGSYQGSILQEWVNNELREEYQNDSQAVFQGTTAYDELEDKKFAFWGTFGAELPPNNLIGFDEVEPIEPEIQEAIEKREEATKKFKRKEKKRKKALQKNQPKKVKPPKEKDEVKESSTKSEKLQLAELREKTVKMYKDMLDELRQDMKDGIYTKEEYKQEKKALDKERREQLSKFEKGGIV